MSIDFQTIVQDQSYPLWNQSPEEVLEIANAIAASETKLFNEIAAITDPSIANVLKPFATHYDENSFPEGQSTFYQHVSTNKELRDASTKGEEIMDNNSIEQWSRADVYQVFQKLYDSVKNDSSLDPESKRYLEKTLVSFKRNGLALPEETREKVKKLQVELNNLRVKFSKNLNEDKGFVLFSKEELEGIPEDTLNQYEKVDGKFKVTFKYPDIFPIFKHASNSNTRKTANIAYGNRCAENGPILDQIIKIRFQIAKLLGYDTFSDYVLEERLAKKKDTVLNFLADLRTKLTPIAEEELKVLKEFKKQDLQTRRLEPEETFYSWDYNYYNERLLEQKYKVDHVKIAEYFPLEPTVAKMLGFYEKIFDIKFVKIEKKEPASVWHEDVQQYAIYQNVKTKSKELEFMGWIYFDLHPREGKYGHAANFGLGPGYLDKDGKTRHTPITVLVCNFTKPSKDKPSLLKHDEVTTFFHELGHGIHNILSKTKYSRFHGTNVERDFVETPSQMLEYWTWSKNELKELSSHYETGEPISDELIDQLISTKHVNSGLFNLRQLFFGIFDMQLHTIANQKDLDTLDIFKVWNDLREEVTLLPSGGNTTKGYASFGHIAGGYESGYYGYLYSLVYATDIYYTLFKDDPMNVENGIRYRDIILKPGGSKEIMDNLVELLGREPNSEAFFHEIFG